MANCGRPGWLASQPFPDVGLASHQLQTRMKSRYRASELYVAALTESDEFLSNIWPALRENERSHFEDIIEALRAIEDPNGKRTIFCGLIVVSFSSDRSFEKNYEEITRPLISQFCKTDIKF